MREVRAGSTPRATTPLRLEFAGSRDGRSVWRLLDTYEYHSVLLAPWFGTGPMMIPAGFVTDLASVPRLPVVFLLAGDEAHEASVPHDWITQMH